MTEGKGITGTMAGFYNVFVDWKGRLSREMPGLLELLRAADARSVLDVGCGTGRHVQALLDEGFDAHGADVSEDMLSQAREVTDPARIHAWRAGDTLPDGLKSKAPFDALIALGNTWPLIRDVDAAAAAFRDLLRPGGTLLLGLKALAVRRETGSPYMPLLKRKHEGRPLWFIRFVDYDVPQLDEGLAVCDMHMVVVSGDADTGRDTHLHMIHRLGEWSPTTLTAFFREAGFEEVRVSGSLADPSVEPTTEDVFVHARAPGS